MLLRLARACVLLLFCMSILQSPYTTLAIDTAQTQHTLNRQDEPVTLNLFSNSNISTLDPTIASDSVSIDAIQNLFLGLTDLDPFTNEIVPEMATDWEVSEDGLTWTFYLRDDVMWMRYDPDTEIATPIRSVVADDFEYAIKRACDPRFVEYGENFGYTYIARGRYGKVLADIIAGCDVIHQTDPERVTDDLIFADTVQVYAVGQSTLEITLQRPAAYFLSMTSMSVMDAVPHETIEAFGEEWTLPGNIVTNGPYFVHEIRHGIQRVFVRNVALPDDLWRGGNIDRVIYDVIEDGGTAYSLFLDNQLDLTGIPRSDQCPIPYCLDPDQVAQLHRIPSLAVFYFGFTYDKAPFDDVHVRRAFSAILEREDFINQLRQGFDQPMRHLSPPSIPHAPSIDEIGVGFDPDYARQQMALAGYPDCEGFPEIHILTYTGVNIWAEFLGVAAEEYLGCDWALFDIKQIEFADLIDVISANTPLEDRPHIWTLGWSPQFPDPHDGFNQVISCEEGNPFLRPCTELDDLIAEAAVEHNPQRRTELYAEIEDGFFGEDGEVPLIPIFLRSSWVMVQPWYSGPFETDGIYSSQHWDAYTIDMAAKLAARDE